jgi:hypothetical protein
MKEVPMNDRHQREFQQKHPHPGDDPAARLRHVLDVFGTDVDDDRVAIQATIGMYGDGITTGITWGDLRALADRLGA